jgi:adenylate cyclase
MTPGIARAEYEAALSAADAGAMLEQLCDGPLIEKWRNLVVYENHYWEIDEFLGENAGLVVAEIELTSEHEEFARPAWLGAEVTADVRYYNFKLATEPYRHWRSAGAGAP